MIRLTDIHKEYQNGTKALKGVSLQIDDGEFVFLVGPSGSGKSTIIKLITAEIEATRGKLMVNGYNLRDISEKQIPLMRRTIGVVFQDFRLIERRKPFMRTSRWPCAPWVPPPGKFSGVSPMYWIWWG